MAKKYYPDARTIADRMECIRYAMSKADTVLMNIAEFALPALPGGIADVMGKQIKEARESLELASRAMRGEDEERTTP